MVSTKNTITQKHCELCYLIGYKNTHHGWSHLNVTYVNWINPLMMIIRDGVMIALISSSQFLVANDVA
ncbi:hypothetical protein A9262_20045 [Vibrio splendidus]|nr:hypothetical protein A9262_20045 [Vibrio splendidus]